MFDINTAVAGRRRGLFASCPLLVFSVAAARGEITILQKQGHCLYEVGVVIKFHLIR